VGVTAGRLIVSLHDVAPPFEWEIRGQLKALRRIGVERCVLKVVPNWHGAYPLPAASSLVHLLRQEQQNGSELVLHGLEHRRRGPLRASALLRVRADLFAGDACEFLTLTTSQALTSILQGRELFQLAGLAAPTAFCAPGWLLAPDLLPVLGQGGMRQVIGMVTTRDLRTSRRRVIPAMGYMGAGGRQERGIQILNILVSLAAARASVMKIYLHHQGGMDNPAARHTLSRIERLVIGGWQPTTYAEVL
jgi:predicted deacetylase